MNLTIDQILDLAPDDASKKSGKELSATSKWVSKGANELAIWGEARGSGSKPYQTQIDVANIAFKCSCPSRKFPCKHGIGLLLYFANNKSDFIDQNMPDWVSEWLTKRSERIEKKATTSEKPIDEEAQAKRIQARHAKVMAGIEELRLWVKDIIRGGIISIPDKGHLWFDSMSRRMIDAQAPGIASMVRNLGEINFFRDSWHSNFFTSLIDIYLVTHAYSNLDLMDNDMQQDIKAWIGITINQDVLKEQEGVTDTWLVLNKQVIETDNLTTERIWLFGTRSNRYALILQFLVRGQGQQITLSAGMLIEAELVFFPSSAPLRALIKSQTTAIGQESYKPFENWLAVAEAESMLESTLPVRIERPYIIQKLMPIQIDQQWWLRDMQHRVMKMHHTNPVLWKLLSYSGGEALDMAVLGKFGQYQPLGLWFNDKYCVL